MSLKKILKSQGGFAVIQVILVGTAITTILSYLGLKNNIALKGIAGDYYSQELYIFIEQLKEVLVDNRTCQELFASSPSLNASPSNASKPLPYSPTELRSDQFGLLASTNTSEFTLGENGMFEITSINLDFASEFLELKIIIQISDKFQDPNSNQSFIAPKSVEKTIRLFGYANPDQPTEILECYYDPLDTSPLDGLADGMVSLGIKNLCYTGPGGGEITPYMLPSMDCYTPGFALTVDSTSGNYVTTHPSLNTLGGPGLQMMSPRIDEISPGQEYINFSYFPNPYWIPAMDSCTDGLSYVRGFTKIVDLTQELDFRFNTDCHSLDFTDLNSIIDSSSKECVYNTGEAISGFGLTNSGMLSIDCDSGVGNRNGG